MIRRNQERDICIRITTETNNWNIQIMKIYQTNLELILIKKSLHWFLLVTENLAILITLKTWALARISCWWTMIIHKISKSHHKCTKQHKCQHLIRPSRLHCQVWEMQVDSFSTHHRLRLKQDMNIWTIQHWKEMLILSTMDKPQLVDPLRKLWAEQVIWKVDKNTRK